MPRLRALDTFRCLSEYKQNKIKLLKLIATRARLIRVILMSYVLIVKIQKNSQSGTINVFYNLSGDLYQNWGIGHQH